MLWLSGFELYSLWVPLCHIKLLGILSNDDRGVNELKDREKSSKFRLELHVHQVLHYAFLYISLPSLHDQLGTWKCLISCFVEDVNDNDFLFLFLNFDTVLKNLTPEKITNIWRMERDRISAIKFEAARIHFLIIWRFRSRRRCCCLSSLVYGDVVNICHGQKWQTCFLW